MSFLSALGALVVGVLFVLACVGITDWLAEREYEKEDV